MKDPKTGQECVFTTGSRGGIGAGGELASGYGRTRNRQANRLPVFEIGSDSYRHKTYGDVSYPTFRIVEWRSEAGLIAGEANTNLAAELNDSVPF